VKVRLERVQQTGLYAWRGWRVMRVRGGWAVMHGGIAYGYARTLSDVRSILPGLEKARTRPRPTETKEEIPCTRGT
jgi:hypothetical protein